MGLGKINFVISTLGLLVVSFIGSVGSSAHASNTGSSPTPINESLKSFFIAAVSSETPEELRQELLKHPELVRDSLTGKFQEHLNETAFSHWDISIPDLRLDSATSISWLPRWLENRVIKTSLRLGSYFYGDDFIRNKINAVSDEDLAVLFNKLQEWIQFVDPTYMPMFKEFMLVLEREGQTSNIAKFLYGIMPKYFKALPLHQRKKLIVSFLQQPDEYFYDFKPESLHAFIDIAGPVFKKANQLFSGHVQNPILKEATTALLSDVKPVDYPEIRRTLDESLKPNELDLLTTIHSTPLKAGTIGQVHLATVLDHEVVVKVRRPDVVQQAKEELEVIRTILADDPLLSMVDEIEASLLTELDFENEAKNIELAKKYYANKKPNIKVATLDKNFTPTENVLVIEKAHGVSVADVLKTGLHLEELIALGISLLDWYEVWLESAFFKDGFLHSDSHGGNLFVDFENNGKATFATITVIDLGNSAVLSSTQQQAILGMASSTVRNDPEGAVQNLSLLTEMTWGQQSYTERILRKAFQEYGNRSSTDYNPEELLNYALSDLTAAGLYIPSQMINFARSRDMILSLIQQVNDEISDFSISGKTAFNAYEVYYRLAKKYPLSKTTLNFLNRQLEIQLKQGVVSTARAIRDVPNIMSACERLLRGGK